MAEVVMDHLTKRYADGFEAVKDMSLDVQDGEFVILVGPSGCGKSTALKMIAGLEDITDGELRIGDDVVNDLAPKDRDIAMVFQNYALYPHMTVRENLAFPLTLAKVPDEEITKKVEEAAQILDLTEHLDRKPANLSGGQRQRVAMGRAIVRDPKAFLMDEPLQPPGQPLRRRVHRLAGDELHARRAPRRCPHGTTGRDPASRGGACASRQSQRLGDSRRPPRELPGCLDGER